MTSAKDCTHSGDASATHWAEYDHAPSAETTVTTGRWYPQRTLYGLRQACCWPMMRQQDDLLVTAACHVLKTALA
jgi:hypothetical protein